MTTEQQPGVAEHAVFEFRLSILERSVGEINSAVKSIDHSMREIVKLQANHAETRDILARAFTEIADHEVRLRELEKDAPTMRLVRGWVVAGVVGIVVLVGVALIGLVVVGG